MLYGMGNSMNNNANSNGLLDAISIASFILQLQNRDAKLIEDLKDNASKKLDEQIDEKLDIILNKLSNIETDVRRLQQNISSII